MPFSPTHSLLARAGSTALYQRHGDGPALAAIESCLATLREVVQQFNGSSIKNIGDELMAVFPVAEDAFRAACEMQWRVSELSPLGADQLAVRIGFHFGPALEQGGDVYGDSVNVAARLVALAKAGQIITSGRTVEVVGNPLAANTRRLNRMALKGMNVEETIFEALWQDSENVTVLMSGAVTETGAVQRLLLRYAGQEYAVAKPRPRLTLGREPTNDVVISDPKASRVHARIELRRDKFVLIDQSTNGTFLTVEGDRETAVRMEEVLLRGRGMLSFGHPLAKGSEYALEFLCEDALELPEPIGLRA